MNSAASFTDESSISVWAMGVVKEMQSSGVVSGKRGVNL